MGCWGGGETSKRNGREGVVGYRKETDWQKCFLAVEEGRRETRGE